MRTLKIIVMMLMMGTSAAMAQKGTKMDLWPNGATYASSDKEDKA